MTNHEISGGIINPSMDSADTTPDTKPSSSSEWQKREQQYWQEKLKPRNPNKYPVEVLPLPDYITPAVEAKLSRLRMAVRSLPRLDIGTLDELKQMGVDDFLARIEQRYTGWRVYEKLSDSEKKDHSLWRLPRESYWQFVIDGKVPFPDYQGGSYAIEIIPKPVCPGSYEKTLISDMFGFPDRFGISWNDASQSIQTNKGKLLQEAGLPSHLDTRMLKTHEWNLMANREGWGKTNTYEWVEDKYHKYSILYGMPDHLIIGDSDGGGAGYVSWFRPGRSYGDVGFRFAVVLGS